MVLLALSSLSACSGGARQRPADLSLSARELECVDLTRGAEVEASWCTTGITSFDVELTYQNLEGHYGLLSVVKGRLLPSPDYEIWDEEGAFVLVASLNTSRPMRELSYLVQSEGQTLRCSGPEQILECTPESP